jgi:integrase
VEWIVRFVRFHGMRSREDLFPAEPKIESFLTDLAVHRNVAAATQNQAMNALVFLYKRILDHAMEGSINAVQADKKVNIPVVMTRDEVAAVISLLDGTAQLVAKLLYGSGLRIMEAVRLRVEVRGRGCPAGPPEMAGRGSYLRSLWAIESTAVVHGADMG